MSGFTLPTSRPITQAYLAEFDDWDGDGVVDYPGGFYHSIGWDGHNGIDYGCYTGDPIEAVADGYVAYAAWAGNHWLLSGGGNAILVEHAEYGVQTEYLHLSRFAVTAGQWVSKGQVIGYSGSTGAATAPHLHLGMLPLEGINVNNRMRGRIDPTPYLYGGITAQGTITSEDDELALTDQNIKDIALNVWAFKNEAQDPRDMRQIVADLPKDAALGVWSYVNPGIGGGDAYQILRDAVANTNLLIDAKTLATAIPEGIAQEVVDLLVARLAK